MKFVSFSPRETKKFAEDFARNFSHGVIALSGELGAGKTTFTQGFAKGLGIRKRIISPTFVFVRRYNNFYHIDAYRLGKHEIRNSKSETWLGLREIFANPDNVVLVEWAENVRGILPRNAVWVRMRHGKHEHERIIVIE